MLVAAMLLAASPRMAQAEALLLIEADTGKVLQAENATYPWYPASVTKIMTAYVALKAVKEGRMTLDTLLTVSPAAAAQSPSKMGFKPGTQVTLDNALKMMMVKSANDIAVVIAEGVGGSIDGFSAEMNKTAQRLGMTQTSYVNPNGLPAEGRSLPPAISVFWPAQFSATCPNTSTSCMSRPSSSAAASPRTSTS
jgi:D-alanyl-D-alanine carboxypeptidase